MARNKDGCVQAAAGPLAAEAATAGAVSAESGTTGSVTQAKGGTMARARVGHEAPDFEASALLPDGGFENLKLSDYRGKWVVLCFYPGDFTFV